MCVPVRLVQLDDLLLEVVRGGGGGHEAQLAAQAGARRALLVVAQLRLQQVAGQQRVRHRRARQAPWREKVILVIACIQNGSAK